MNRRLLLLLLAVALSLVAVLFVARGSGSSASVKPTPTPKVVAQKPVHRGVRTIVRQRVVVLDPQTSEERHYAVRLAPVIDHSTYVFDSAVGSAASSSGLDALAASCAASVQTLGVQEDYVEGVPHNYPWFHKAGLLHHEVIGIYHDMEGAAVACHTAASNGDDADARTDVRVMAAKAKQLHSVAKRVRALARRPH